MIKLLSKQNMENLTTARLLAYKNKLMQVPETANWEGSSAQITKDDPNWQETYTGLKAILSTREHVEK